MKRRRQLPAEPRPAKLRVALPILVSGLAGLAFVLPMVVSHERYFRDWRNHLYLIAKQARAIETLQEPTFFLNTVDRGWFYPFYAFYGATLYTVVGSAAAVWDSPWAAYVASYAVSAAAAFAGWVWLARLAGARGWLGYLGGAVWLGAPYYVTNAYGRGAWPEFVAVSCFPAVLAAGWSNLTRPRVTWWSLAALAVPLTFMTGSHTITLVFSVPFAGLALLLAIAVAWKAVRSPGRIALVSLVAALAVGLNAWFLVPVLAYRDTLRVQPSEDFEWRAFDQLDIIFSPIPRNPYASSTPELYVQAPLVPLLVAVPIVLWGMIAWRGWRMAAISAAPQVAFFLVLALITGDKIWDWLPWEARIIQFPYRLNSYLLACVCGLVVAAAAYAERLRRVRRRSSRIAAGALAIAALAQVLVGGHQMWTARTYGPAEADLADLDSLPGSWYEPMGYANVTARSFPAERLPLVEVKLDGQERRSLEIALPGNLRDELVRLNVFYSPFIAAEPDWIEGQARGFVVISVPDNPDRRYLRIQVVETPATVAGWWISFASLVGLAALMWIIHGRGLSGWAIRWPGQGGAWRWSWPRVAGGAGPTGRHRRLGPSTGAHHGGREPPRAVARPSWRLPSRRHPPIMVHRYDH